MKQKSFRLWQRGIFLLALFIISVVSWSCRKDLLDGHRSTTTMTLSLEDIRSKYYGGSYGKIASRGDQNGRTPLNAQPLWQSFLQKRDTFQNEYFVFEVDSTSINLDTSDRALLVFFRDSLFEIRSQLVVCKILDSTFYDDTYFFLDQESNFTGLGTIVDDNDYIIRIGKFENGYVKFQQDMYEKFSQNTTITARDESDDDPFWLNWFGVICPTWNKKSTAYERPWWDKLSQWFKNLPPGSQWRDVSWAFLWRSNIGWDQFNLYNNSGQGGGGDYTTSWQNDYINCKKKIKEEKIGGGDPNQPISISNTALCDLNANLGLTESQFECLYNKGFVVSALNDFLSANSNSTEAKNFAREYTSYCCTFKNIIPPPAELFELFSILGYSAAQKTELLLNRERLAGFLESLKSIKAPQQQAIPHFLVFPPISGHSLCQAFFTYGLRNEIDPTGSVSTFQWTIFNNLSIRLTMPNGSTIDRQIGDNWVFRYRASVFDAQLLPNVVNSVLSTISQRVTNGSLNISMVQTTFLKLVNAELGTNGFLWTAGSLDQNLCSFYIPRTNTGQIDVPFRSISFINLTNSGCP